MLSADIMKTVKEFVKSALVGGLLFLLPVGMVLVFLGRVFVYAQQAGTVIHDRYFPSATGNIWPLFIAVLLLLSLALLAGLLIRTTLGRRLFQSLEDKILNRVPVYTISRQMIGDMTGAASELVGGQESSVVLVELDDMTVFGFLMEYRADGKAVVYLPGAPSALSGSVIIVAESRVTVTTIAPTDVMGAMRRLGAGLAALEAEAREVSRSSRGSATRNESEARTVA